MFIKNSFFYFLVECSLKPAGRGEINAAVRGSLKPAVRGEINTAVRGSLKPAGLSAVKPAGSSPKPPGYGATPGVLSAHPHSRAHSSCACSSRSRSSRARSSSACSSRARSSSARSFRVPPWIPNSPQENFWGVHIAMAIVAGPKAKAKEPDPPWLPESPDPPWRPPLSLPCSCPAPGSRAPAPPPRWYCYGARRAFREGAISVTCWFLFSSVLALFGISCSRFVNHCSFRSPVLY